MSVTTGDLIQLLQLIILAFTAVVFISQSLLRFFLSEDVARVIDATGQEQAMDQIINGVQTFFLSIAFFMIGGTVISLYLVLVGATTAVGQFMDFFEANLYLFGAAVLVAIAVIALFISGDYENPHTGVKGIVIATFLTGGVSVMIVILYVTLWAVTRSTEWVFFIGTVSVAVAMFTLLFGSLILSEVLLDVVENYPVGEPNTSEPSEE